MAPDIEKPSQDKDKKNNKENAKGVQWHIPYSVGKIRMDQDKGIKSAFKKIWMSDLYR